MGCPWGGPGDGRGRLGCSGTSKTVGGESECHVIPPPSHILSKFIKKLAQKLAQCSVRVDFLWKRARE